jgi:hypothetical protein
MIMLVEMKAVMVLLSLIGLVLPWRVAAGEGQVVRGPTYEGVIFTPQMLPKKSARDPDPLAAAGVPLGKGAYWTPTAAQVDRFEKALVAAFNEAEKKLPPPGARDRDFAAPKTGSRDWRKPAPADFDTNFIYDLDPSCFTPQLKRQYIGVTVAGQRMLVANLACNYAVENPEEIAFLGLSHWKREWFYIYDAGHQIFYDLATGKMWEIDT